MPTGVALPHQAERFRQVAVKELVGASKPAPSEFEAESKKAAEAIIGAFSATSMRWFPGKRGEN